MNTSFLNTKWHEYTQDQTLLNTLKQQTGLSEICLRLLLNRGISTVDDIKHLCRAQLKNTIPDPYLILDMERAILRIEKAIEANEKVVVFGDYDVDGITSTFLLVKSLSYLGLKTEYYIPSRLKDGYGLSKEFVRKAHQDKITLIITTDTGIGAIDEVKIANSLGIDVVIFDHHPQLTDTLPEAVAVVDPNRKDQKEIEHSFIKHLCAAGVVFVFMFALLKYRKQLLSIPKTFDLLPLASVAAIGTIGDLVELKGINRAFVKYMISHQNYNIGLQSLLEALGLNYIASAEEVAFKIGPALNAAGRLGQAEVALELLLSETKEVAIRRVYELFELNDRRKEIEAGILHKALCFIEKNGLENKKAICVFGDNWHEGVIGIISGKLREKFQKPAFVITFVGETGRGSARSVPGLHIGQLIQQATVARILEGGGGHALAGGFEIKREKINQFCQFVEEFVPSDLYDDLFIDDIISPSSNIKKILDDLQCLLPFGAGFPAPLFCMKRIKVENMKNVNDNLHTRFIFTNEFGIGRVRGVLFHSYMNSEFVKQLCVQDNPLVDILGSLSYDERFGPSVLIRDMRLIGDKHQEQN